MTELVYNIVYKSPEGIDCVSHRKSMQFDCEVTAEEIMDGIKCGELDDHHLRYEFLKIVYHLKEGV